MRRTLKRSKGAALFCAAAVSLSFSFFLLTCSRAGNTAPENDLTAVENADPVVITAVLDEKRSSSVFVQTPSESTTVTAEAEDGTVFTLVIPPDALYSPEAITLTPVSEISGLPFSGGLRAAVEIEPEGLRLRKPAVLTITPPGVIPADSAIAFGYQHEELFLHPMRSLNERSLSMQLMHFSGYGIGTGSEADRNAQRNRTTHSAENNYQQAVSEVMNDAARRSAAGDDTGFSADEIDRLVGIYRSWYESDIKNQLTAAQNDRTVLGTAIRSFLSWLADVMLVGLEEYLDTEHLEGMDLITSGIIHAIDDTYADCKAEKDVSMVSEMLRWERDGLLLGVLDENSSTFEKVRKCASFQLEFTSHIEWDTGLFQTASDVEALVPLTMSDDMADFSGSGTLVYSNFSAAYSEDFCRITSASGANGTLAVSNLMLDLNVKDGSSHDVFLILEPSDLVESMETNCTDASGGNVIYPSTGDYWYTGFHLIRQDSGDWNPDLGVVFKNWNVTGGATYATRELGGTWTEPGGTVVSETGSLRLLHTPQ